MTDLQAMALGTEYADRANGQTMRVALFTATHHIVADVETGPRRLVEVLRDVTRAHLDLKNVTLSRIGNPSEIVATSSRGVLQKAHIQIAAILSEEKRPERRLYGYVPKTTVRVMALVAGCEVLGEMHLPEGTHKEGVIGYLKLKDTFIHLGDSRITFGPGSAPPTALSTVIVNRMNIQFVCLAE